MIQTRVRAVDMLVLRLMGVVVLGGAGNATSARGQWTVIDLNPPGVPNAFLYGVWGNCQVGVAYPGDRVRASVWSGSATSWIDLSATALSDSEAMGVFEDHQVGYVRWAFGGGDEACRWRGTAGSRVNLHPMSAMASRAICVTARNQAGWAMFQNQVHAMLWNGNNVTWVDLNPAGSSGSGVAAMLGDIQAGGGQFGGVGHAGIWHGTPESWLDLHPAGAVSSSLAGLSTDQQVGRTFGLDGNQHAALWTGTPASWVDLHPGLMRRSEALGVSRGIQIGWTVLRENPSHAALWTGSAQSWKDLHNLLPAGYRESSALGIWNDSRFTYVAGYGSGLNGTHAILWKRCRADFNEDGSVDFFDYDDFVQCFEGSGCPANTTADFNGDGAVDFFDYEAFVGAFEMGC